MPGTHLAACPKRRADPSRAKSRTPGPRGGCSCVVAAGKHGAGELARLLRCLQGHRQMQRPPCRPPMESGQRAGKQVNPDSCQQAMPPSPVFSPAPFWAGRPLSCKVGTLPVPQGWSPELPIGGVGRGLPADCSGRAGAQTQCHPGARAAMGSRDPGEVSLAGVAIATGPSIPSPRCRDAAPRAHLPSPRLARPGPNPLARLC